MKMVEDNRRSGAGGIGDGIRTGIGILTAFKEAVEETLQEAVDRGDLSPNRAKQAMQGAADRLQAGLEDARDRFDVVTRRDFEALRDELADLRVRIARLEENRSSDDETPSGIIITE
jgi:polyhydroxyalkanoate synthesis regulator phasin